MTAGRPPVWIAVAVLVLLTAAIALAAGQAVVPAGAQGPPTSAAWFAAVRAHAPGAVDEAVVTISRWPAAVALATVRKALHETTDPAVLQRALILHTDAAIAERAAFEAGGRIRPGRGALLLDARRIGTLPRSPHWDIGREIAATLIGRPGGSAMVQRWYRTTGAVLQQWADCGALRPHLDAALRLLPDDPVLLLYQGTLHQTYADQRVQRFAQPEPLNSLSDAELGGGAGLRRDAQGNLVTTSIGTAPTMESYDRRSRTVVLFSSAAEELGRAERDFRRAVGLDPSLVEARIRLAHVLVARGQPADAFPLAAAALASPLPPFLEYYAAMVLGWSAEAQQRPDDARRAFDRAAGVFPRAQSAQIAISRQALEGAHAADGLAAILASSGPKAARDAGDPWWSYFRVHEPDSKTLLAALRGQAP